MSANTMIQMNATQAAQVSGPSPSDARKVLTPIALPDGTFYVGAHVLNEPGFADRAALLQGFPQIDYDAMMNASAPLVVAALISSGGTLVEPMPSVVSGGSVTS